MSSPRNTEKTKFWRLPHVHNLELLHASYRRHTFNRHFHEGYAIGIIEDGALGYYYRGENVVAAQGDINLAIPGETHNGFAADGKGWQYRMFYLDANIFHQAAAELTGKKVPLPFFSKGVIHDRKLASELFHLHCTLEKKTTAGLEMESRLLWLISKFILHHSNDRPALVRTGNEKKSVARVKAFIEDNYRENIRLEELSRMTGLSRFHLLRVFRRETGIPPHSYQNLMRVRKARDMLLKGIPIVEAAHAAGFYDQSHLNRFFKRIYGVTPGQYSNSIQDR